MTTKTQIEIDFDVNNEIKNEISKSKKMGMSEKTKEKHIGEMVEKQHQLQKLMIKKGINHDELINLIKKQHAKS